MSFVIKYRCPYTIHYRSTRYGKEKTVPQGYPSDGASGPAMDIWSEGWWIHDALCYYPPPWPDLCTGYWDTDGLWDDGEPVTVLQSSTVLHDILLAEGRWFRARTWWLATYVAGKCREWFT
jgi:hypothetical protein